MVNLAGVERLPTPPFIDVVDTEPSGTVRFALLGETEHGVSMSLPTKFTVPSAARAAWADAASAMSTAALVRRISSAFPESARTEGFAKWQASLGSGNALKIIA